LTKLLQNIIDQPAELLKSLHYTLNEGRSDLDAAVDLIRQSNDVFITGIGSSWHAGMAVQTLFNLGGRPAILVDAGELWHYELPAKSIIIALARSGESLEIVQLVHKAKKSGIKLIGITNAPQSQLRDQSDVTLLLNAAFDHLISVTMYSALTLVGGILAAKVCLNFDNATAASLEETLKKTEDLVPLWYNTIVQSDWLEQNRTTYFLARSGSFASASETRLLWEEAARQAATALTTGSFRHGPQEIIKPGIQLGLWLDGQFHRKEDLKLIEDLQSLKCRVMTIGQHLPDDLDGTTINLPTITGPWQFLIDIIPGQLAAEHLSRLNGVDCDRFNLCPYIIKEEGGLL